MEQLGRYMEAVTLVVLDHWPDAADCAAVGAGRPRRRGGGVRLLRGKSGPGSFPIRCSPYHVDLRPQVVDSDTMAEFRQSTIRIPWVRHVVEAGTRPTMYRDYLWVPPDGRLVKGQARQLSQIDEPVILLLGEPRMGKTDVLTFDVGGGRRLIEGREIAVSDVPSDEPWIVDALDGHSQGPEGALADLERRLRSNPVPTRLWLSCQTANWTEEAGKQLARIVGNRALGAYVLAPLTWHNVQQACEGARALLDQIEQLDLHALASRPLALRSWLDLCAQGALPNSRTEFYRVACEGACGGDERVLVCAGRLAAWMVLAQEEAIGEGREVLTWKEIAGEPTELIGGKEVALRSGDLRQVVRTGMIVPHQGRFIWRHRSLADYLGAWYLARRNISGDRLVALFRHPAGGVERH